MGGTTLLSLVLLAPAAPPPAGPPAPPPARDAFDRNRALHFSQQVLSLATNVVTELYVRPVEVRELVAGAVRGLYEEAGRPVPGGVRKALDRAAGLSDFEGVLTAARIDLGDRPALAGPRAFVAAANGFRYALDPGCGIVGPRANGFASIDMDFGIGVELDGVTGLRWALYQAEYATATGRLPADPAAGRAAKPVPPAAVPWRVNRVVPGSPAQRAGLRPGDVITHYDGTAVTGATAAGLFERFAAGSLSHDVDPSAAATHALTVRRAGAADPIVVGVKSNGYVPESVFGVIRTSDDAWDWLLDRDARIGYIRVGAIERGADARVAAGVADLVRRNARALVLDLRWCPGGWVDTGTDLAGLFLADGQTVARLSYRNPAQGGTPDPRAASRPGVTKWPADRPVVVLVGSETTGGGELIAAALQDHGRAAMLGQRTVGRAQIQQARPAGVGNLMFKLTVGHSLRPTGKPRQRLPESGPGDDWGVRPDPGLEVPITPDLTAELRHWAEAQALRPAKSNEALPFDDLTKDPPRHAAVVYLRKRLAGKPAPH